MNTLTVKRNQNISLKKRNSASVNINLIALSVIAGFLVLLYVSQVTKADILNYELADSQTTAAKLTEENEFYAIEVARLQSIEQIRNSSVVNELVSINNPTYLEVNN